MPQVFLEGTRKDKDVIKIDRHKIRAIRWVEVCQHFRINIWNMPGGLVKAEWHHLEFIKALGDHESRLLLSGWIKANLPEPRDQIDCREIR